jgi:hypothetical protein
MGGGGGGLGSCIFHFWNLEQSSTEKAGIHPTYHEPFQEVVTSPLPTPLRAEQTWFYSTAASTHFGLAGFLCVRVV